MKQIACLVSFIVFLAIPCFGAASPIALWTSDPVLPGQTVLVFGDGFTGCHSVHCERLPDTTASREVSDDVTPLQVRSRSVKFVLPAALAPGVFRAVISTPNGQLRVWVNRPQIIWVQGDQGQSGTKGGWLRVIGKCLSVKGRNSTMRISGLGRTLLLRPTLSEAYTEQASLPLSLSPGLYQVSVHSGAGGAGAWSDSVPFLVSTPFVPPPHHFIITRADEDADANTTAIQKALDTAGIGGGVVILAAGRYLLDDGLKIPPHVILRGAGMGMTALCWVDSESPPEALIRGHDHFRVEDLCLYAVNYQNGIIADQATPTAGHVSILRVRMRLNPYRGHITPEEVSKRFVEAQTHVGGGDALRLGGADVEVAGCDIYAANRCLYLSKGAGAWIHDNLFSNGRWGWYCISGSNGVIFERNSITGGDLMSTGGGVNCLDGSFVSQNVYFANNTLKNMFGWDREAMTSDAGGGAYYGRIVSASGAKLLLAADPQWAGRDWVGAGVFILAGAGQGQYRQIVLAEGRQVTLDRPWQIVPDNTSVITITMLQRNYLFIHNTFADAGVAIQLYGTAIGDIASGNVSARTAGFHSYGMNYDGIQPSWYNQWLDNEITEGNSYLGSHEQAATVDEAHLAVQALPPGVLPQAPLVLCAVIRANRLDGNAHLEVNLGSPSPSITFPYIQEVVVEDNQVTDADYGLSLTHAAQGVLARHNTFIRCAAGIVDADDSDRVPREHRAALYALPGPLLRLDFSAVQNQRVTDATGHNFVARCEGNCRVTPNGPHGASFDFDGKTDLKVAHPEWIKLSSFTLSLWIKTDHIKGQWAFLSKRFSNGAAPFILGEYDGCITFNGADERGQWDFNVQSSPILTPDTWHFIACVRQAGQGVILYAAGKEVARFDKPGTGVPYQNDSPLYVGRDAIGGDPDSSSPSYFSGSLAGVQLWPRALSPEEIARLAQPTK